LLWLGKLSSFIKSQLVSCLFYKVHSTAFSRSWWHSQPVLRLVIPSVLSISSVWFLRKQIVASFCLYCTGSSHQRKHFWLIFFPSHTAQEMIIFGPHVFLLSQELQKKSPFLCDEIFRNISFPQVLVTWKLFHWIHRGIHATFLHTTVLSADTYKSTDHDRTKASLLY